MGYWANRKASRKKSDANWYERTKRAEERHNLEVALGPGAPISKTIPKRTLAKLNAQAGNPARAAEIKDALEKRKFGERVSRADERRKLERTIKKATGETLKIQRDISKTSLKILNNLILNNKLKAREVKDVLNDRGRFERIQRVGMRQELEGNLGYYQVDEKVNRLMSLRKIGKLNSTVKQMEEANRINPGAFSDAEIQAQLKKDINKRKIFKSGTGIGGGSGGGGSGSSGISEILKFIVPLVIILAIIAAILSIF